MPQAIAQLTRVSKIYPPDITALDQVSLTVHRGEILFLAGMSGAGKSTLLKLLCGLESASRGVVEVLGHDMARINGRELQRLRQRVGVAYQDFRLLDRLSVRANVAMAMEVTYKHPAIIRRRVDELLDLLLLSDKSETPVAKLSRGEQQRVAIARAAANAPPLILADEPTGNLDDTISRQVMLLMQQLNDAGSTVIIATHDQALLQGGGHRVVELRAGRILREVGP